MKIIMKVSAVLIAVATIYIVVLWEPTIKTDNNTNITDENNEVNNDDVIKNSISDINTNEVNENIEDNVNDENLKNDAISNDVVITVDLKSVIEKLTLEDKTKVNNILKKLSVTDYSRFVDMLSSEDGSGGAVKAFTLLKRRISTEDYKSIEELLGEYVDFSIIDIKV